MKVEEEVTWTPNNYAPLLKKRKGEVDRESQSRVSARWLQGGGECQKSRTKRNQDEVSSRGSKTDQIVPRYFHANPKKAEMWRNDKISTPYLPVLYEVNRSQQQQQMGTHHVRYQHLHVDVTRNPNFPARGFHFTHMCNAIK